MIFFIINNLVGGVFIDVVVVVGCGIVVVVSYGIAVIINDVFIINEVSVEIVWLV